MMLTLLASAYGSTFLLVAGVVFLATAGALLLWRRRKNKAVTALLLVVALLLSLGAGGVSVLRQASGLQRGSGPEFTLNERVNRFTLQQDVDHEPFAGLIEDVGTARLQEMQERFGDSDLVERHRVRLAHGYSASDMLAYYVWRMEREEKPNSYYRAVMELDPRAIDQARRAGAPDPDNPLHGAVVMVKGNIAVRGLANDSGSWALADAVAGEDAEVVSRLRAQGAVIAGRTNLSEFANFLTVGAPNGFSARGGQALSPAGPLTVDPLGSSTGSATSIALDFADLTVGTETAGSVLAPAEAAGVVGLKASHGGCSIAGIVPIDDRVDAVGFFGRSVRDTRLAHDAACGPPTRQAETPRRIMVLGDIPAALPAGLEAVAAPEKIRELNERIDTARTEEILLAGAGPSLQRHLATSTGRARTIGDIVDFYAAQPETAPFGAITLRQAARTQEDGAEHLEELRKLVAEMDEQLRAAGVDALVSVGGNLANYSLAGAPRLSVPWERQAAPSGTTSPEVALQITAAREDALPEVLAIAESLGR
ncbi:amidase family protein [Corynebacterium nasicanis]